jgi:hypothetical protein
MVGVLGEGGPVRRLVFVVALLVAAGAGCSDSNRVHVLGRDYSKSGPAVSLSRAQEASFGTLVVVHHGRVVSGSTGLNVPTVIYVENGDRYTPYSLEGGP